MLCIMLRRQALIVSLSVFAVLGFAIAAHSDILFKARQPVKIGHGKKEGAKIHWTDCSGQNPETFDEPPYSLDLTDNFLWDRQPLGWNARANHARWSMRENCRDIFLVFTRVKRFISASKNTRYSFNRQPHRSGLRSRWSRYYAAFEGRGR